jgi:hypothetical protein
MQNSLDTCPVDIEFEISGEKLEELDFPTCYHPHVYDETLRKINIEVHNIILKQAWSITSIEKLKNQIIKKLDFVDLVKVKLDFGERQKLDGCSWTDFSGVPQSNYLVTRNIEALQHIFTENLFGWVYYNENEELKTFRFILNIANGEIKYLNN